MTSRELWRQARRRALRGNLVDGMTMCGTRARFGRVLGVHGALEWRRVVPMPVDALPPSMHPRARWGVLVNCPGEDPYFHFVLADRTPMRDRTEEHAEDAARDLRPTYPEGSRLYPWPLERAP